MKSSARDFAQRAHGDQQYGELPYVVHLQDVVNVAQEFNAPREVSEAAWLHDVLEDTDVTGDELYEFFGAEILALVEGVTNKPGRDRSEQHRATYPGLRTAGSNAVMLKLCDRIANIRASKAVTPGAKKKRDMYQREYPEFRALLYVVGEYEAMWNELDRLMK